MLSKTMRQLCPVLTRLGMVPNPSARENLRTHGVLVENPQGSCFRVGNTNPRLTLFQTLQILKTRPKRNTMFTSDLLPPRIKLKNLYSIQKHQVCNKIKPTLAGIQRSRKTHKCMRMRTLNKRK